MQREQFFQYLEHFFARGLELVKKKNADYTKDTTNPFSNFEFANLVGVAPERAILVRVADKLSRISNLLDRDNVVKSESIDDTLLDMCNYLAILSAMLKNKKNNH